MKRLTDGQIEYLARDCLDGGGTFEGTDVTDTLAESWPELNLNKRDITRIYEKLQDLLHENRMVMYELESKHFPNGIIRDKKGIAP